MQREVNTEVMLLKQQMELRLLEAKVSVHSDDDGGGSSPRGPPWEAAAAAAAEAAAVELTEEDGEGEGSGGGRRRLAAWAAGRPRREMRDAATAPS